MPREPRSTERLIGLLATVNGTAIDGDIERGYSIGSHIQELCHEASVRLASYWHAEQDRLKHIEEEAFIDSCYIARPACTDGLSSDEIGNHDAGC